MRIMHCISPCVWVMCERFICFFLSVLVATDPSELLHITAVKRYIIKIVVRCKG